MHRWHDHATSTIENGNGNGSRTGTEKVFLTCTVYTCNCMPKNCTDTICKCNLPMAAILAEYRLPSNRTLHCSPILLSRTLPTVTRRAGTAETDRKSSSSCLSLLCVIHKHQRMLVKCTHNLISLASQYHGLLRTRD